LTFTSGRRDNGLAISFTVGEGAEKENKMRFWTLTALTMTLAMVASNALAQNGANTVRTVQLESSVAGPSDGSTGGGGGEPKGQISIGLENAAEAAEFGEGASFQLNLRSFSCPGTINWAGDMDLDRESRTVWVLYLTVGDDLRRIITFRPDCSSYGTTWAQTQINGFLIDANEPDPTLWNERVMTDDLTVEIIIEVIGNDELSSLRFEGFSPAILP
jgi:hypothetical protein